MRHDRRFWEHLAAAAESSELTHGEVAARHGVSVSSLRTWIYRLRRERERGGSRGPRLLPVRIAGVPTMRETVEVSVGEMVVHVPVGADPAYVASLVAALQAC